MEAHERMGALLQALSEPLRFDLLRELMRGPATVSELTALTGASQPNVSNHLAVLRERGLARATREGRQMLYEVRNPAVASLIEALAVVAQAPGAGSPERVTAPLARARTCYDHLAGQLGVAVFDALVARGAVTAPSPAGAARRAGRPGPSSALALGPAGDEVFEALGVSVEETRSLKRRFAYACVDWTERRPHLGGALGAALCSAAVARGWVARQPGARVLTVTDAGWQGFHESLGMALPQSEEALR